MATTCLNTLFVQRDSARVRLDHDTLRVEVDDEKLIQVPLQHLESVVLFGNCTITSRAMQRCVAEGRQVVFLDYAGRFMCRVVGPTSGNVLLRLAQYRAHEETATRMTVARKIVVGKIRNSRRTLLRGARDARMDAAKKRLIEAAGNLARALESLSSAASLDAIRGCEGDAAREYFGAFADLLTVERDEFAFALRSRRPPRDRVNASLSFVYALLVSDVVAALEGVGLDPQVGMLHGLRPGRASLALDLAEELRSCLADRLVLTLINRRQLRPDHFDARDEVGGSVLLNEEGRRLVLHAYQTRKRELVTHALLKKRVPFGYVTHLQARLLARWLRGDISEYPPYIHGG
ncbi:MAG: type I-C CRISPR-associated endonuclease Cas1c [Actinomycetota bacterium]|nr:type I-C CRISPR-associated endonuclease Cas1c [Actinomycetota bacterium]